VAPAGYGKTHLIAQAVAGLKTGRELLLTHTHAGVRSMRRKLQAVGAESSRYHVETIAGWCLRYALSYPQLASLPCPQPRNSDEWDRLYAGVGKLISCPAIAAVIAQSYSGLIVDEYQDCNTGQHRVVMALAALLPTRVLGDPLQSIFRFDGQQVVDWDQEVLASFRELPSLDHPHRWAGRNEKLGAWLDRVRGNLVQGQPVDLGNLPVGVSWAPNDPEHQRKSCFQRVKDRRVIGLFGGAEAHRCHYLSRRLGGNFQVGEPVDSEALYSAAESIERGLGADRAAAVVKFGADCFTGIGSALEPIVERLRRDPQKGSGKMSKHLGEFQALQSVALNPSLDRVGPALDLIAAFSGAVLFRRELWQAMMRSLKEFLAGGHASLYDAAWSVRQAERAVGRREEWRSISRTVLAKGLEYDHGIVLDASTLDREQLYVALTRASYSLTILSPQPVLQPQPA